MFDIWICVYRYTAFCVYVDGRKEIIVLDYLLQIQLYVYMFNIQVFVNM